MNYNTETDEKIEDKSQGIANGGIQQEGQFYSAEDILKNCGSDNEDDLNEIDTSLETEVVNI